MLNITKFAAALLLAFTVAASPSSLLAGKTAISPQIFRGTKALPPRVAEMARALHMAARSGNIENLREVLDMNELKPMTGKGEVKDPIADWKRRSIDGTGHDILAVLLNILETGYVVTTTNGNDQLYLWPYFAGVDISTLTAAQKTALVRLLPADDAVKTLRDGRYSYYRLGIGADGTWHFFSPP